MTDYNGDLGDRAPASAGGRHMIRPFEVLAAHHRACAAKAEPDDATELRDLADLLDLAARCILNEAARADRAERKAP